MTVGNHKFRYAFITMNTGHDFSPLSEFCSKLVFCSTGYESEQDVSETILQVMKDFDPEKDLIVPVGSVASNLILGATIAQKSQYIDTAVPPQDRIHPSTKFFMAFFKDKTYHVREMFVPPPFEEKEGTSDELN